MTQPNIVLINVDQWRGDCLGFAGHPVVETPHLDNLYAAGVHCSRAYTAVPSCIAARASLWTGLKPRTHGRVGYQDGVAWNYPVTLPSVLTDAGYQTQSVGRQHFFPPRSLMGFQNCILHDGHLGFHRRAGEDPCNNDDYLCWLKDRYGRDADAMNTGVQGNSWVVRPWIYDEIAHPSNWVVTEAIDFLRRRDPRKPFFLNVGFIRPHAPLDPPAHYLRMYERKELPPAPVGDWPDREDPRQRGLEVNTTFGLIGREKLDRARRGYYALMTQIDHQISRLLMALNDSGAGDACILFVSDHGELMGDHNHFRKIFPWEGSARVPFVLRPPRSLGLGGRRTIDAPVELRDVMPTLLDVAGVDIPDTVEGRSILPLLRGEDVDWREYIHGEHAAGGQSHHFLVSRDEKYVWFSQTGREQLFDIAGDPQELHDLSGENPERLAWWRQRLVGELTGREEGYVADGELVVGRKPKAVLDSAGQG